MDLRELGAYVPRIERLLAQGYSRKALARNPEIRPYVEQLGRYNLRGGKRFRAQLVLGGYFLVSGEEPSPALPAAVAMEHFQAWMLIHDDIIDHSEQRRGGPSLHRWFSASLRPRRDTSTAESYGVGIGITLGDLEEPLTLASLLSAQVPTRRILQCVEEFARMTELTAFGQLLDVRNSTVPPAGVTEREVLKIHRLKSAVYTVSSPLRIGAVLAGAGDRLLSDLSAYGDDIGVAFQLRDDVLGAGFEGAGLGKSANDLVEGKRTLLVIRALHEGTTTQRSRLLRVLGNPRARRPEVEAARVAIRESGSLAYTERMIARLYRRAMARVGRSRSFQEEGRPLLDEIATRLVQRRR